MKNRFSHIVRTSIVTFLMAGMLAHLLVPFTSHAQKTAFTQWLNHNVAANGDEAENELRSAIRKLPEQTSDFRVLVEQASQLVANNRDEFRLNVAFPVSTGDHVTSWLVSQWNVFQQHQTGTDALLPETSAPVQKWLNTNNLSKTILGITDKFDTYNRGFDKAILSPALIRNLIEPLTSGISINAP
ncbi:hypothetical protein [Rhodohalobacter barkolensis]|uniref:Uncharacterized protein n=1 Tax=Rhodohalobacter barkolensis TaxID=2053187 RepID=A0A2N0VFV3_9BACT|nr:hypothetical protein [Rhodohalobacter barkolensis]PKD43028.1 hypothetical protein CWD77_10345 [Rhodohalobacter barkolensis]